VKSVSLEKAIEGGVRVEIFRKNLTTTFQVEKTFNLFESWCQNISKNKHPSGAKKDYIKKTS